MSYSTAQMRSFSQAGRSWRHCLDAAHLLKRYGYDVTAVSVARLNPLDEDFSWTLSASFASSRRLRNPLDEVGSTVEWRAHLQESACVLLYSVQSWNLQAEFLWRATATLFSRPRD